MVYIVNSIECAPRPVSLFQATFQYPMWLLNILVITLSTETSRCYVLEKKSVLLQENELFHQLHYFWSSQYRYWEKQSSLSSDKYIFVALEGF